MTRTDPLVGLLLLGVVPLPLVVYSTGASWGWGGVGALAWLAALVIKTPVTALLYSPPVSISIPLNAALSGLISSLSELGLTALVLGVRPLADPVLANLLAFGAGAACAETLFVLGALFVEVPPSDQVARWIEGAKVSFCVRHVQAIERLIAFGGQVGARGLVGLAIYTGSYAPALVALVSFALTDGLAAYGSLSNWNWSEPGRCRRFYGACAAISAAELSLFAILIASLP